MIRLGIIVTAAAAVSYVACGALTSAADSVLEPHTVAQSSPLKSGIGATSVAKHIWRAPDIIARARDERVVDERLLLEARDALTAVAEQADVARARFTALKAQAADERQEAYAISNAPGLSAEQNRNSIVAMDAADAADTDARAAQVSLTANLAGCVRERAFIDGINARISELDRRIASSV